jgi:hypothetical protein
VDTIKRMVVRPGISPGEMKSVWETAIREAENKPGTPYAVVFMPGNYPLPEEGTYVYKNVPTILHAASPGVEVLFRYLAASGEMLIRTRKTDGRQGHAAPAKGTE